MMDLARYLRRLTQQLSKWRESSSKRDMVSIEYATSGIFLIGLIFIMLVYFGLVSLSDYMTIILTTAIALFAAMQGKSMVRQEELLRTRYRVEDLRDQLEKVYGRLYSLLDKRVEFPQHREEGNFGYIIMTEEEEKRSLVRIMTKYPHMFPKDVWDMWTKIRDKDIPPTETMYKFSPSEIYIPEEFKNRIVDEYNSKIKEYHELLGRENSPEQSTAKSIREGEVQVKSGKYPISHRDVFLLLYGTTLGLIAGTVGGLWSTLYYEHIIKGDVTLSSQFWSWSIILVAIIAFLLLIAYLTYRTMTKEKK